MAVEKTAGKSRQWPAWAGDRDRLTKLVATMRDLFAQNLRDHLRELDETEKKWRAGEGIGQYADDMDAWITDHMTRSREAVPAVWDVSATSTERELAVTNRGQADAVLNELDPLAVVRLQLVAGNAEAGQVQVAFDRGTGCSVQVSGPDPAWVRGAFGVVEHEVAYGIPWWRWMRSEWGGAVYGLVLGVALVIGVVPFVRIGGARVQSSGDIAVLMVAAIPVAVGLGAAALSLVQRVLPGFEVIPPGGRNRGTRVFAVLGSLAASFGLAIVANLLTK